MALVRLVPPKTPYIGQGRWTWPLNLLSNEPLLHQIQLAGTELQTSLENLTTPQPNAAQTLWKKFKNKITDLAKRSAKTQLSKIDNKIKAIEKNIKQLQNEPNIDTQNTVRTDATMLENELKHLHRKRYKNAYIKAQALWHDKGEKISKYWMATHNPKRPKDVIYALRDPRTDTLTTKTNEMTDIARHHHESLQDNDRPEYDDPQCRQARKSVLEEIPTPQKLNDPNSPLHALINIEQTHNALNASKNRTATGLDGIPYEVWKTLDSKHIADSKMNRPSFDIVKCLCTVYNEIQTHGTDPKLGFSEGWMCPIYKKKDRTKIENYRPITLLNMDYKIMTKALATQLAPQACNLLHPDQTGFVPNRSILDPIRLAESMCAYADYMEENGAIVALDQEKAYDKIDHKYLLDVLKAFNLPELFIDTVKSLYQHATTSIAINGVLSTPYQVSRGVRQGDPLSCLLFNLAIEPLAATVRNTPNLSGFVIPGTPTNIKINLYADDTMIYLSENDKYETLQEILTRWCKASGARFNIEKTEIVPIGTQEHCDRIIATRKLHPKDTSLQNTIKIAQDGTAIRCLGAWIGNKTDQTHPWNPIIDKIKQSLDEWSKSKPTLDAKRLIIQMTVGAMTQFLTSAQGMPKSICNTLTKITRDFIWDGKKSALISMKRLQRLKKEGGIELLDLEARNTAIETMWLKRYLDTSQNRPQWAFTTDAIINCIKPEGIRSLRDVNIFLTSIRPQTQTRQNSPAKTSPPE